MNSTAAFVCALLLCASSTYAQTTIRHEGRFDLTYDARYAADADLVSWWTNEALDISFDELARMDAEGHMWRGNCRLTVVLHATPDSTADVGRMTLKTSVSRTANGPRCTLAELHALTPSAWTRRCCSNVGLQFDHEYWRKTMLHETFTLVLDVALAAKRQGWRLYDAPSWFVQGVEEAQGLRLSPAAWERYVATVKADQRRVLSPLLGFSPRDPYLDGAVFVAFLYQTFGRDAIFELFESDQRFDVALELALKTDRTRLEELWTAWIAR